MLEQQSIISSPKENNKAEEVNQDRVPTRKIAPYVEPEKSVDILNVGVKSEARKATSKRKSWNADNVK